MGDTRGIAASLHNLGIVARERGEYAAAASLFEQSLPLLRDVGDTYGIATSLISSGDIARQQGDYARAKALSEEGLALHRDLGDTRGIAISLTILGEIARNQGDYARADLLYADLLYKESLALFQGLGNVSGITASLGNLGDVACDRGDYGQAHTLFAERLALHRESEGTSDVAAGLEGLARVAVAQGQPVRAGRLLGAAEALRTAISAPLPAADRASHDRTVAAARQTLEEECFAAARAAGAALPLEQAIAEALRGDT